MKLRGGEFSTGTTGIFQPELTVPRRFLRFLPTEAPSLYRSYPASSVLRTSPPSPSARPSSRELPVDPHCDHRWDFPCCAWSPLPACRRQYPGRSDGNFVRSYVSIIFGLPSNRDGSAPALRFSRPAQRSLTLRPACSPGRLRDPLHQRLQQSRCLHCCSDCYRVERTSSRAGLPPLWTSTFFTAHPVRALIQDFRLRKSLCQARASAGRPEGDDDEEDLHWDSER